MGDMGASRLHDKTEDRRAIALDAATRFLTGQRVDRTVVIRTAAEFEKYIRYGKPNE